MKGHLQLLSGVALAGALVSAAPATAQTPSWFGNAANGNWAITGKVSTVQSGEATLGDATTAHIGIAYEFTRPVLDSGSSAIEVEAYGTLNPGDNREAAGEWEANGWAAHVAYRTKGDIYFKAKLGVTSNRSKLKVNGRGGVDSRQTGFSYGIGAGMRLKNNAKIELEFANAPGDVDDDVTFISLGGQIGF